MHDFADNYLEIIKKRVYQGEGNKKLSVQYTLYTSLLSILKMFSPIMPFITEEIFHLHFKKQEKEKSIHISSWPEYDKTKKEKIKDWKLFLEILSKVRYEKTKHHMPMNAEIILSIEKKDFEQLKDYLDDLKNVTNAKEIKEGEFRIEFV